MIIIYSSKNTFYYLYLATADIQLMVLLNIISYLDLEGKTDMKIRALEEIEELRTLRADKQV